ncbi:MAG: glycosyltransferase involved in cell wall biosynthesis [Myxococcota bacterium]|jgi:glycosyltransferase involved in cell wall biosynthesis
MFNEAEMVEALIEQVKATMASVPLSYELICIDDGSSDGTGALLRARTDVVPVLLSRNFGKEPAMVAGLTLARGRAVILMDADLQHPPSLIPDLIAKWEAGFDVVNAVKSDRGQESLPYRLAASSFYRIISRVIGQDLRNQSDFKLLDRQVVDALLVCEERNRFLRGLVAWLGFSVAEVPFVVSQRAGGQTSWSFTGLVRYSTQSIVAFSSAPLISIAWLGFITTVLGVLLSAQTLWNYASGVAVDGFTTTILVVLIMGGTILVCLGVIAVYLAAIYDELKRRPVFVVRTPQTSSSRPLPREISSPAESPSGQ